MTDLGKLEHIIYLVNQYQSELSRSKSSYDMEMQAYFNCVTAFSRVNGKPPQKPKSPMPIDENSSDYIKRIKAILEVSNESS